MTKLLDEKTVQRLRKLQGLRGNFEHFSKQCLKIVTKKREMLPFTWNRAQRYFHDKIEEQRRQTGGVVRALALKGRQQGISTYVAARFYHRSSLFKFVKVYILSHMQQSSDTLFKIVDRYHQNNQFAPHVGKKNQTEMEFDKMGSSYTVATAGEGKGGRSMTASLFHGCLSPHTFVLDENKAPVKMSELQVGNTVITHTGAKAGISFISEQKKATYSVKLLGYKLPVEATAEHRFWTKQGWKELGDIEVGECIGTPVRAIKQETCAWPFLQETKPRPQGGGTSETGPKELKPTYALGRVLGLYLAEGTIVRQHISRAFSGVAFSVHDKHVERTLEWLKPLSHCYRNAPSVIDREDCKTSTVTVYGRSFATFVYNMCGAVETKKFPSECFLSGSDFAQGLVHGYIAGDGHSSKTPNDRRITVPSIRGSLTFTLQEILASLGYGYACISYKEPGIRRGRDEKAQWILRLTGVGVDRLCSELGWAMPPRQRVGYSKLHVEKGYAWAPVLSIEPQGVNTVMDLEVDHPDHSYLIAQGATHNSEVAFWSNAEEHFSASVQTIPFEDGTEIILESTANGPSGKFYELWQEAEAGKGDYIAVFIPWFWQDEYTRPIPEGFKLQDDGDADNLSELEYYETFEGDGLTLSHMVWRRAKVSEMGRDKFNQEYPATAEMAFVSTNKQNYIPSLPVLKARKREVEGFGPLVLGIDPAGEGGDRFAITARRGRRVEWVKWRDHINSLEATHWVKQVYMEEKPARMFIDAGNIGAAVITNLRADDDIPNTVIRSVNFGSPSEFKMAHKNSTKKQSDAPPGPVNRRAEMYQRMKQWLELEEGVSIPDLDVLQGDLTATRIKPNLTNDLQLESKHDMRKRGVRSPDLADSLALTFASLSRINNYEQKRKPVNPSEPDTITREHIGEADGNYGWMS